MVQVHDVGRHAPEHVSGLAGLQEVLNQAGRGGLATAHEHLSRRHHLAPLEGVDKEVGVRLLEATGRREGERRDGEVNLTLTRCLDGLQ